MTNRSCMSSRAQRARIVSSRPGLKRVPFLSHRRITNLYNKRQVLVTTVGEFGLSNLAAKLSNGKVLVVCSDGLALQMCRGGMRAVSPGTVLAADDTYGQVFLNRVKAHQSLIPLWGGAEQNLVAIVGSNGFGRFLSSLEAPKLKALGVSQLIPGLTGQVEEDFLLKLSGALTEMKLRENSQLIRERDTGKRDLYFVRKGQVQVVRGGKIITRLGPQSIIGEGSWLTGEPRNASVIGLKGAFLYRLPTAKADALTKGKDGAVLGNVLAKVWTERYGTQLTDLLNPVFGRKLDALALTAISCFLKPTLIRTGETIRQEGQTASQYAYFILRGRVRVSWAGGKTKVLGPGSIVGEKIMLRGGKATATVTAEDTVIAALMREVDFKELSSAYPDLAATFERTWARRAAEH